MARRKRRYKRNAETNLVNTIKRALGELEETEYRVFHEMPMQMTHKEYALQRKLTQIELGLTSALKVAKTL